MTVNAQILQCGFKGSSANHEPVFPAENLTRLGVPLSMTNEESCECARNGPNSAIIDNYTLARAMQAMNYSSLSMPASMPKMP
jgi:hypothetical protein